MISSLSMIRKILSFEKMNLHDGFLHILCAFEYELAWTWCFLLEYVHLYDGIHNGLFDRVSSFIMISWITIEEKWSQGGDNVTPHIQKGKWQFFFQFSGVSPNKTPMAHGMTHTRGMVNNFAIQVFFQKNQVSALFLRFTRIVRHPMHES